MGNIVLSPKIWQSLNHFIFIPNIFSTASQSSLRSWWSHTLLLLLLSEPTSPGTPLMKAQCYRLCFPTFSFLKKMPSLCIRCVLSLLGISITSKCLELNLALKKKSDAKHSCSLRLWLHIVLQPMTSIKYFFTYSQIYYFLFITTSDEVLGVLFLKSGHNYSHPKLRLLGSPPAYTTPQMAFWTSHYLLLPT